MCCRRETSGMEWVNVLLASLWPVFLEAQLAELVRIRALLFTFFLRFGSLRPCVHTLVC